MDFKYPNTLEDFENLLQFFQRKKAPRKQNYLWENIKLDRFTVMYDVSGLADRSKEFANFLTVSRKFGLTGVYIFHTIYPARQNWQMILAQTKIFNIFPGLTQASSIVRILSSFCYRYRYNYIPNRDLWINRLYFDIFNSSKKQWLTIDTRDVNHLGPAKFRTQPDNNKEQICYYNQNKRDTSFTFLAVRKQTPTTNKIIFSIVNLIDKTNKNDNIYLDISDELSDFNNDNVHINDQFNELVKVALSEQQALTENSDSIQQEMIDESAKSPDFFQNNKPSEGKYTTTRIKSINFLSNISYDGINKEDFYIENFIFDVYLLVTKNLNPFSLDRKLNDQNKHEMTYMLWRECMPQKFYKYICKERNFTYLNR